MCPAVTTIKAHVHADLEIGLLLLPEALAVRIHHKQPLSVCLAMEICQAVGLTPAPRPDLADVGRGDVSDASSSESDDEE